MMNRKTRDQLQFYQETIEQNRLQIKKLQEEIDTYREREQALVDVLTKAQKTADNLVLEARAQVKAIYDEADRIKLEAQQEKQNLLEEANQEADRIREEAKQEAEAIVKEANDRAVAVKSATDSFLESLRSAAKFANEQAKAFAIYCEGSVEEMELLSLEQKEAFAQRPDMELPEEYESPKELIQSIYKIQGRSIPIEEQTELLNSVYNEKDEPSEEQAEAEEEKLWTVEEVAKIEAGEEIKGIDQEELNALIDDLFKD